MVDERVTQPSVIETDPFLVVEKPVGWSVELESGRPNLHEWLIEQGTQPAEWLVKLDYDESGLVVGGDPDEVEIRTNYLAMIGPEPRDEGRIARPLYRRGVNLDALTEYRQIETFGFASLVELQPDLPRLHQVREHMQSIGLSVVGDRRFQGPEFVKVPRFPGRLWLHLAHVRLANFEYESSLPEALAHHLEHLRAV